MARKITMRNTKSEILDAYDDMKEELKGLRAELKRFQVTPHDEDDDVEPAGHREVEVAQVLSMLKGFRVNLADLTSTLQRQLSEEASRLQELLDDAREQTEQIVQLHGLELHAGTLDELITRYEQMTDTFEQQLELEREAFEQQMSQRQEKWLEEQLAHDGEVAEREATQRREREREEEAYRYDLERRRALDVSEYERLVHRREQELEDFETERREALTQREDELREREQANQELREKVARFDEELEQAIKKAKGEGAGIAKHQARVKADLLAKEHEGKRRVFELRIARLEETAGKQRARIEALNEQLLETKRQAQSLAAKALDGASNATTFEAIREIAIEQAKRPLKNK